MTVLSRLEATPSRVAHLLAVLAERGQGETEERLRAFFSPEPLLNKSAGEQYTLFRATLGAARDLGLVETIEDRLCVRTDLVKRGALVPDLLTRLEGVLLPPDLHDGQGQADFARAVTWFLLQSPTQPLTRQKNYKLEIQAQLGPTAPTFDLLNTDRWNSFTYWCRYLGYGVPIADRAMIPDPTAALRRHIAVILNGQRVMAAEPIFARLAERTPVFEGGAARREVEALRPAAAQREAARLSPATSFALMRLEREGLIRLTSPSDAPPLILDLGPDPDRRFSQVELAEAAA